MIRKALPGARAGIFAILLAVGFATAAPPAAAGSGSGGEGAQSKPLRPNVIVFNSDDQPASTFSSELMPTTFKRIVRRGTDFREFVVSTPLCCPSRAVLATGQYGHNNNVLTNSYNRLKQKRNVLPRWLQRAGYTTIHVGRFFNGYEGKDRELEVAPGWDVWRTLLQPRQYYNYELQTNQGTRSYGQGEDEHLTKVLSQTAAQIVAKRSQRRRPFFLQLDFFAPHVGRGIRGERCNHSSVPAPEDRGRYAEARLPIGPSFNETDLSDKPEFMQSLPGITPASLEELRRRWACALRSVRSLDRGIGQVISALKEGGAVKDTLLIFTSDNGYFFGEHRIDLRKHYPLEEGIKVPFAMRLPRAIADSQRRSSDAAVANVDIVPTILELTGAEPCLRSGCRTLDGRSLVAEASTTGSIPPGRAITLGYDQNDPLHGLVCSYTGLRTRVETFVLHFRTRSDEQAACVEDDAIEHYVRRSDPFQLENLFPGAPSSPLRAHQSELFERIVSLSDCSGIAERDPPPQSGNYCE